MKLADDDFTLLGLPRRQALDAAAIDHSWRALQAEVHPDRFVSDGAAAQRLAMQWATRLNQARQRLRDPLTRAAYLCELAGVAIDAERNTAMPQEFLLQQLQWREALEETGSPDELRALQMEVTEVQRDRLAALEAQLADPAEASGLQAAAANVRALMFVRRFLDELEQRLETLEQAR